MEVLGIMLFTFPTFSLLLHFGNHEIIFAQHPLHSERAHFLRPILACIPEVLGAVFVPPPIFGVDPLTSFLSLTSSLLCSILTNKPDDLLELCVYRGRNLFISHSAWSAGVFGFTIHAGYPYPNMLKIRQLHRNIMKYTYEFILPACSFCAGRRDVCLVSMVAVPEPQAGPGIHHMVKGSSVFKGHVCSPCLVYWCLRKGDYTTINKTNREVIASRSTAFRPALVQYTFVASALHTALLLLSG